IDDAEEHLVARSGSPGQDIIAGKSGVSLRLVRTPTLANRLLEAEPDATILSISLKDRGAVFAAPSPVACPGGTPFKLPSPRVQVVWQDEDAGLAVTSSYFAVDNALPAWARDPQAAGDTFEWKRQSGTFVEHHALTPDNQEGEDTSLGGSAFNHQFKRS